MRKLPLLGLCLGYGVLNLYLLLGWFATGQPQRPGLWQKLYGPLTFDLTTQAPTYGGWFLGLSALSTVGFMVLIVRMNQTEATA